jgi:AraC family transcriptional regulator
LLETELLARLEQYVFQNVDQPLTVATLARFAGLSPSHFSRIFTETTGYTPHGFVIQARLQRAIELVRVGQFRLADIAMMTGFADQSHLARWVRRAHGVTLTDIRRRNSPADQ